MNDKVPLSLSPCAARSAQALGFTRCRALIHLIDASELDAQLSGAVQVELSTRVMAPRLTSSSLESSHSSADWAQLCAMTSRVLRGWSIEVSTLACQARDSSSSVARTYLGRSWGG